MEGLALWANVNRLQLVKTHLLSGWLLLAAAYAHLLELLCWDCWLLSRWLVAVWGLIACLGRPILRLSVRGLGRLALCTWGRVLGLLRLLWLLLGYPIRRLRWLLAGITVRWSLTWCSAWSSSRLLATKRSICTRSKLISLPSICSFLLARLPRGLLSLLSCIILVVLAAFWVRLIVCVGLLRTGHGDRRCGL